MEITEVKIFPVGEEKLKAFVSIVFDHSFMVNDIKVIQGRDGLFISMPSRRKKNGDFKDVAHPLNNETRRRIEDRILSEYDRAVEERSPRGEVGLNDTKAPPQPIPAAMRGGNTKSEAEEAEIAEERSLKEVEELHLRDSFWSVP